MTKRNSLGFEIEELDTSSTIDVANTEDLLIPFIKAKNSKNVINDKMLLIFDLVQKYHIFYHSMKKKNNKILV